MSIVKLFENILLLLFQINHDIYVMHTNIELPKNIYPKLQ